MAEIELQRAGVVALVGDFVAAGVAQHVWVHWKADAAVAASAPQHLSEAAGGHRRAAFSDPDVPGRLLLAFEAAQRPQLDAAQWMGAGDAALGPDDMEQTAREIDLAPFEPTELADAQAMPVGDEDHRGIAVAIATALASSGDQRVDLGRGQVFAWPVIDVALSARRPRRLTDQPQLNCTIPVHWSPLAAGM